MNKQLKDKQWSEFFIDELGVIKSGKDIAQKNMVDGNTPYISATSINNGINNFVDNENNSLESKCISINRTGSVGYAFYHEYTALFSNNCRKFILNEHNNKYVSLFIVNQIKQQKEKYSYGYIMGTGRLKRQKIMLPIDNYGNPDFEFMEEYVKNKYENLIQNILKRIDEKLNELNFVDIVKLNEKDWSPFFIDEIGDIHSGKDITKINMIMGDIPYISSTSKNNGINAFVGNNNTTLESNCISINRNGSVGYAFYHPYSALFSNDCRKLKINKNKHVSLFIVNQIKQQKEKYNYGYKMGTGRLKRQQIMLPISEEGEPDYNYMEQYMINLEIKLLKKYIDFVENNNNKILVKFYG